MFVDENCRALFKDILLSEVENRELLIRNENLSDVKTAD